MGENVNYLDQKLTEKPQKKSIMSCKLPLE